MFGILVFYVLGQNYCSPPRVLNLLLDFFDLGGSLCLRIQARLSNNVPDTALDIFSLSSRMAKSSQLEWEQTGEISTLRSPFGSRSGPPPCKRPWTPSCRQAAAPACAPPTRGPLRQREIWSDRCPNKEVFQNWRLQ